MATAHGKFRNAIVCEDIRDEIGNKRSLMGIMAGDILVPELPATIKMAFFLEYEPSSEDGETLSCVMRLLLGDDEILKAVFDAPSPGKSSSLVLPTGLLAVEKETVMSVRVAINGRPEEEVISKRISLSRATA